MKRSTKKGFTIVELVIVIAVIAILAAVLIPTFSSLIRKANIASDTQLAKNLNTALTMGEAENGAPDDFAEVLQILRDNGFIISNLNPTTKGWYYVWESASNQIILVDGENNYAIKYQSKEIKAENTTPGATWHFAVSEASKVASIKALGAYVIYAPKTTEALEAAFGDTFVNGGTIAINSDILMGSGNFLMQSGKNADRKVNMNLSGNTITNTSNIDYTVEGLEESKRFGQLTAAEGTLVITNGTVNSHSNASFVVSAIENGKVELDDVVINSLVVAESSSGVALRVLGEEAEMKAKDVTVNLKGSGGGCEIGIGTATFENVNITVDNESNHFSNICLSASRNGTLTIESGTYTAKGKANVIGLYPTAGNIVINGGTFSSDGLIAGAVYLPTVATYADKHTIALNGGTFNFFVEEGNAKTAKTVVIDDLTAENYEAEILSMFKGVNDTNTLTNGSNIKVEKTDGGYLVTIGNIG